MLVSFAVRLHSTVTNNSPLDSKMFDVCNGPRHGVVTGIPIYSNLVNVSFWFLWHIHKPSTVERLGDDGVNQWASIAIT